MGGVATVPLVVFALDQTRFALALSAVARVVPMPAVTPLPAAPAVARGAVNLRGEAIPVLDVRSRFGFPQRDYGLSTRLLIATTGRRRVALPVDAVEGVERISREAVAPSDGLLPGLRHVSGVVALQDGLLFIHDLEAFLSLEEALQLDTALGALGSGRPAGP